MKRMNRILWNAFYENSILKNDSPQHLNQRTTQILVSKLKKFDSIKLNKSDNSLRFLFYFCAETIIGTSIGSGKSLKLRESIVEALRHFIRFSSFFPPSRALQKLVSNYYTGNGCSRRTDAAPFLPAARARAKAICSMTFCAVHELSASFYRHGSFDVFKKASFLRRPCCCLNDVETINRERTESRGTLLFYCYNVQFVFRPVENKTNKIACNGFSPLSLQNISPIYFEAFIICNYQEWSGENRSELA